MNADGIDRAKAPNTRRFSKARSMRAVLRATNAAKEICGGRTGISDSALPRQVMRRRVTSCGAERGTQDEARRLLPRAVQAGAGGSRHLVSGCCRRNHLSEMPGREARETSTVSTARIVVATKHQQNEEIFDGRYAVGTCYSRAITNNRIARQNPYKYTLRAVRSMRAILRRVRPSTRGSTRMCSPGRRSAPRAPASCKAT